MSLQLKLLEKGIVPDSLIRIGIRDRLKKTIEHKANGGVEMAQERLSRLVAELKASPISIHTDAANRQHYELPASFFEKVMGKYMKYSCGLWSPAVTTLDASEESMLSLTVKRGQIKNGDRVLELGCGWGSLSLYMAARFPQSQITAVSNSGSQKQWIDAEAEKRGLKNLTVMTVEMSRLETEDRYDRVISVEMFEHMRNYELLFKKVDGFLKPQGTLFVHVFAHREYAYLYDEMDPEDWIARYFFTGGTMPSDHLFYYFQNDLKIESHWRVNGQHYAKTCRAWLENMDKHEDSITVTLKQVYGDKEFKKWRMYWRVFFMACEELFAYNQGNEWLVSHYLLRKLS